MSLRLTTDELEDLCYRHCELAQPLTDEEIDALIDAAYEAHELAHRLKVERDRARKSLTAQRAGA